MTIALSKSKFFVMYKGIRRFQRGRGARFQNNKIVTYDIVPRFSIFSSAWRPSDADVTRIIGFDADYSDIRYPVWRFNNKRAADNAWMLLLLKYSD